MNNDILLEDIETLDFGLDVVVKEMYPELENLEVTPTKEQQVFNHENSYGYDKVTIESIPEEYVIPTGIKTITENGISNVYEYENVEVDVPMPILGIKTITENGTYNASDDNLDGYSSVEVETSGEDISEYFSDTIKAGDYYHSGITEFIKKIPNDITMSGTSCAYMFTYLKNVTEVPYFDTSGVTTMEKMFQHCHSLKNVPLYNTSDVTNMSNLFDYCYALESIPLFDTSKVTKMDYMISYCTSIEEIPAFDTSNVTSMAYMFRGCQNLKRAVFSGTPQLTGISYMFYNCESLEYVEGLDTGNVSQFGYLFNGCRNLHTIPLFDCEKCDYMISAFTNCLSLVNVGGFKNYGKAFTKETAHYNNYSLEIRSSYITEDSYWNIANTLYDLNITYDVANGGTLYRQYLKIGPTQIAMLQSTERGQEILTLLDDKGWDVI